MTKATGKAPLARNTLLLLALSAALWCMAPWAVASELYFVDAHSQMDEDVSIEQVRKLMKRNGVKRTLLASRNGREPHEMLEFAQQFPQQIVPLLSTKQSGYVSDDLAKQQKSVAALQMQAQRGAFQGMAETLMWHSGCPNAKCPSVLVRAADRRVQTALEIAIDRGWPMVLHIEFASLQGERRAAFFSDLKSLLQAHPQHPFALIHMGQLNVEEVQGLISEYPNIHFLTAHTNPLTEDSAGGFKPWVNLFEGQQFAAAWAALLTRHPERFVFALDNVWGAKHWKGVLYDGQVELWRQALERLPEPVAHAIAHANAERLWRLGR